MYLTSVRIPKRKEILPLTGNVFKIIMLEHVNGVGCLVLFSYLVNPLPEYTE